MKQMRGISILASGMVTGVGLNSPATCAAIRVGITGFTETRFMFAGEWLLGCPVPLNQPWRGREKLIRMAVPAIEECLEATPRVPPEQIALVLCLAEPARPGRLAGLDESLLEDVQARMKKRFHPDSAVIANGRYGGVKGIGLGWRLLARGVPYCVVAGVDSYLVAATLTAYDDKRRLKTEENSDGFIPGEAAAAVLIAPTVDDPPAPGTMQCLGTGGGTEPAPIESEEPLRADGLVQAIQAALKNANRTMGDMDYRITDNSGEQYGFKESTLALQQTLRVRKAEFDIWHPADCAGEIGAAIVPCCLGVALAGARKNYAPGDHLVCHCGNDDGERAALVLEYTREEMN